MQHLPLRMRRTRRRTPDQLLLGTVLRAITQYGLIPGPDGRLPRLRIAVRRGLLPGVPRADPAGADRASADRAEAGACPGAFRGRAGAAVRQGPRPADPTAWSRRDEHHREAYHREGSAHQVHPAHPEAWEPPAAGTRRVPRRADPTASSRRDEHRPEHSDRRAHRAAPEHQALRAPSRRTRRPSGPVRTELRDKLRRHIPARRRTRRTGRGRRRRTPRPRARHSRRTRRRRSARRAPRTPRRLRLAGRGVGDVTGIGRQGTRRRGGRRTRSPRNRRRTGRRRPRSPTRPLREPIPGRTRSRRPLRPTLNRRRTRRRRPRNSTRPLREPISGRTGSRRPLRTALNRRRTGRRRPRSRTRALPCPCG